MEIRKLYGSFFNIGDMLIPYTDDNEVLTDLFSYLDLCFTLVTSARGFIAESVPDRGQTGSALGLSVSSADLGDLLISRRDSGSGDRLSAEAIDQVENARFHIEQRRKRGADNGFLSRFDVLCLKFGLSELERFSLLLALSVEYDRKYEAVYTYLHNNSSDYCPTKWLAVKLYEYLFGVTADRAALTDDSPLCRFLCERGQRRAERGDSAQRLSLSPRVSAYLLGKNELSPALTEFCRIYPTFDAQAYVPVRVDTAVFVRELFLDKALAENPRFALNIYGPVGIGRRHTASIAAESVGLNMLDIDLYKLLTARNEDVRLRLDMIYTETELLGAVPCFTFNTSLTESDNEGKTRRSPLADIVTRTAEYISSLFGFFFWITPEKSDIFSFVDTRFISVELPMLTANERRLFWEHCLGGDSDDISVFANQYILTPDSISKAAASASDIARLKGVERDRSVISEAIRLHSVNQLGNYATKINAVFTWDDLVVSEDQKRKMKMICDQVKYRGVVNEDWGFAKKSPYGRGLCALFYGSPGTGKTMAVQVMANELGVDLYRIDLSQLTSKYIGETQKNISALFAKAKNINAMLFFDEADSMFAKRSEVKDANDRYANADTAFLLQKLEDYEGITILATNYVNNIDDAFKRRIRFMINFVFPTPDVRLMLWQKILPPSTRTDEEIDFEFYAEHFELSGSNIKEILTNAAYLAAAEHTGLCNRHVIEAIKLNFSKYGKILTNEDFGYLGT